MSFFPIPEDHPHVLLDITEPRRMTEILDWIHETFDLDPWCQRVTGDALYDPQGYLTDKYQRWLKVALPTDTQMVYLKLRWG